MKIEDRIEVSDQCPICNNPAGIPDTADGNDSAFDCAVCGERLSTRMDISGRPIRIWLESEATASLVVIP